MTRRRGWLLAVAAVLGIVLAVAPFAWRPLTARLAFRPPVDSLAVLPVRNLTGDRSLDVAADRMTEDASYVLGRGGVIRVAPRDAVFAFKGRAVDPRAIGRALDVRHVVDASLREAPPGWRLSVQVVDATTGRVEGSSDLGVPAAAEGAFPEARLAMSLFESVADVVQQVSQTEALARPVDDNDPESVVARLVVLVGKNNPADIPKIERLLSIAHRVVPPSNDQAAFVRGTACYYYSGLIASGYATTPALRALWAHRALAYGARAAVLRPATTAPYTCRAEAYAQLQQWDEAEAEARHVIEIFPLTANGYEALAQIEFARGRFAEALAAYRELADRAEGDPLGVGTTELFMGEAAAAVDDLREAVIEDPKNAEPRLFLAAALQSLGRHAEAVREAAAYRASGPGASGWSTLAVSSEPAFVAAATKVRAALHAAGIDPPSRRVREAGDGSSPAVRS